MKKQKNGIIGKIIAALFLLVEAVFMGVLFYTKMIPVQIMLVVGVCLLVLALIVGYLTFSVRKLVRFSVGTLMAFFFTVIFAFASMYIYDTAATLSAASGVTTETAQIGIYVRANDAAQALGDTKGYTYGILAELDRENTDKALEEIQKEIGSDVAVSKAQGLTELVDSLMNKETGAIILNQAYLPVLEEIDGYAKISSMIREIDVKYIETVIEKESEKELENRLDKENKPAIDSKDILTVFVSGIDNRGGIIARSRSDVNIIAVANTKTKQLLLLSTPRDYFVPLSISNGVPDKLTHAGIYGVEVSMDTLGMLYDTEINDYIRMNFGGFERIIDALGGVDVNSDYDFTAGHNFEMDEMHFNKGVNHLSGEQALAFARERYAFKEGDRQRGKNQMAVIKGVINKALSPELLMNYSSLLASVEGSFETSFSYDRIGSLVQQQLTDGGAWNIVSYSVDGTGDSQKPYSMSQRAYVMLPNYDTVNKAKELMQKVRDGETLVQE